MTTCLLGAMENRRFPSCLNGARWSVGRSAPPITRAPRRRVWWTCYAAVSQEASGHDTVSLWVSTRFMTRPGASTVMWTLSFPDRVNAVIPWKVRMAEAEVVEPRPCANHPRVQTVVSCGRCDKPLCPRCMIYTPVGVRCRDCAQMRRPPQYTLTPRVYARVLPTAVALALVCGFLLSLVPYAGFLAGIVIGLLVGAALRRVS